MSNPTANNENGKTGIGQADGHVRIRARNSDGQTFVLTVTRGQADRLRQQADDGRRVSVTVDSGGVLTGTSMAEECSSLPQAMRRFALPIDPPDFPVFQSAEWVRLQEIWTQGDEQVRILLSGPEGTGKDTLIKCLVQRALAKFGPQTAVLTLPVEDDDRYVNHLECKAEAFAATVSRVQQAGRRVLVYFPELESIFARGNYSGSYDLQYQARLRDLIDGTKRLAADFILACCNNLARLDPPLLSRFRIVPVAMSEEFARGVFRAHWPVELSNGLSADHVLDQILQRPIATATLVSRKTRPLRAPDLTGFNGRFLADLAADIRQQVKHRRFSDPAFTPDGPFAAGILRAHLAAIIAPVAEAAGTDAVRRFFVNRLDPADPAIAIEPTLDWCRSEQYLAS